MMSSKNDRAAERRARVDRMRQQQKSKERRRSILGGAAVGLVAIALIALIVVGIEKNNNKVAPSGPQIIPTSLTTAMGKTTVEPKVNKVKDNSGIDGVIAYDTTGDFGNNNATSWPAGSLRRGHVSGPVKYGTVPPVGGDHYETWMNAGVYTAPVPNERAVHLLEHGAIWITYRPDLSAAQIEELQKFVGKQSFIDEGGSNKNRFMLLSPWADKTLPSPIVFTSWGHQLYVTDPKDPRLQKFVDKFRNSKNYTPEFGSGADGVPIHDGTQAGQLGGGQPTKYGSKYANPENY